jgi:hypothetical protein
MNSSGPATPHVAFHYAQEIDDALAALAAVQPREGLEQRVLACLASAPELPWYRRLGIIPVGHHRWALAAASAVIVAGGVTMTTYRQRSTVVPTPAVVRAQRPAQQPAAAAASVGVSDHPLAVNKAKTRHRGVHRSYRAMHEHVPLPRGTAAPLRPQTIPAPQ